MFGVANVDWMVSVCSVVFVTVLFSLFEVMYCL